MTSIAYYFAGVATIPVLVIVLARIFPNRKVDNFCLFCKRIERFPSYKEAEADAKAHIHKCQKHPLFAAEKRIAELEDRLRT